MTSVTCGLIGRPMRNSHSTAEHAENKPIPHATTRPCLPLVRMINPSWARQLAPSAEDEPSLIYAPYCPLPADGRIVRPSLSGSSMNGCGITAALLLLL